MPELPDIICYQESLERVVVGANLDAVKVASPFVLEGVDEAVQLQRALDESFRLAPARYRGF